MIMSSIMMYLSHCTAVMEAPKQMSTKSYEQKPLFVLRFVKFSFLNTSIAMVSGVKLLRQELR